METLREFRRRRGWSQKDLADESGVGQDTISGIESGRHEPRPSTLRKLAEALNVEVADFFREPALPLAEAPRETGQRAEEPEEEQHIPSIHPSFLEQHIELIKLLKEQREAEIEEVKQGAMPRVLWDFHLEADNKYLEIINQAAGISAFVEEITSGRRTTDFSVQRVCHEFSRQFSDFVKLADEAKALNHQRQSDTHVKVVKEVVAGMPAVERYLHDEAQKQRSPES